MIKNIIIIGAGDAGKMLAKEILYSKKNKDYKLYSKEQISESIDDCVIFILKMIKKHAEYLLK